MVFLHGQGENHVLYYTVFKVKGMHALAAITLCRLSRASPYDLKFCCRLKKKYPFSCISNT